MTRPKEKPPKATPPALIGHCIRHPNTRKITVFDSAQRAIYTFKPERPEEMTIVVEIAPDGAVEGLS